MVVCIYDLCQSNAWKFSNKGLELFKYMHTVRMAASRGYSLGWVNYDEQYRLRKATSPSSSWGVVDMELWMLCVSTPPSGNIGFGNVERQSRNSPPIAHTSHTVNLGSTLNFQRRSDTNNSVCRLFNRGFRLPETCWEVVSHSDWQTWKSCQTEK